MKNHFSLFLIFATAGIQISCATSIPYSNEELCAIENLKFDSLEKQEVISILRIAPERQPLITRKSTNIALCTEPKTSAEKRQVQSLKSELEPKIQFNAKLIKSKTDYDQALAQSNEISSKTAPRLIQATFPKDE